MIKLKKNTTIEAILFLVLLLISVISVIRVGNHPGLYADSVMPDFIGVQVLNPNSVNPSAGLPNLGYPLLGQLYHGTMNMLFSMLATIITGTTSILQLRIVNCLYGAIACFVIYKILKETNVHKYIAVGISLALAASPNLTSMYRTQYYVELPGVVCFLIAVLMLVKWKNNGADQKLVLMSGVFSGLAFYNYYNFLFCIPGIMLSIIILSKNREGRTKNLISYICGCALGETPGIVGYFIVCIEPLTQISLELKRLIALLFAIVYAGTFVYAFISCQQKKRRRITYGLFGISLAALAIIAYRTVNLLSSYIKGINIAGKSLNLGERLSYLWKYVTQILCHSGEEYLVINADICSGLKIVAFITLIAVVISLVGETVRKPMRSSEG